MSTGLPHMECGHSANAVDGEGNPACAICAGIHPGARVVAKADLDLTGRTARCTCGTTEPSSLSLAFFEFCGEGSRAATDSCSKCGYSQIAHEQIETRGRMNVVKRGKCDGFVPHGPWEHDRFYCGCRGWD